MRHLQWMPSRHNATTDSRVLKYIKDLVEDPSPLRKKAAPTQRGVSGALGLDLGRFNRILHEKLPMRAAMIGRISSKLSAAEGQRLVGLYLEDERDRVEQAQREFRASQ